MTRDGWVIIMLIQSQGIITRGNGSVDVPAVAYFRVADAVKSVIAIESVRAAAPLMTTIAELGSFLAREQAAVARPEVTTGVGPVRYPDGVATRADLGCCPHRR
jgi:regulator of protease activity HflC (stomatin/prohibitin superfamily)